MLPSAPILYFLQNIPPWCASQTVQSAEESVFAERRYSASVINVNGPQRACANKEIRRAAKVKESFRLSLPPRRASPARGEALDFRCGLLRGGTWAASVSGVEACCLWMAGEDMKGLRLLHAQPCLLPLSTFSPSIIQRRARAPSYVALLCVHTVPYWHARAIRLTRL